MSILYSSHFAFEVVVSINHLFSSHFSLSLSSLRKKKSLLLFCFVFQVDFLSQGNRALQSNLPKFPGMFLRIILLIELWHSEGSLDRGLDQRERQGTFPRPRSECEAKVESDSNTNKSPLQKRDMPIPIFSAVAQYDMLKMLLSSPPSESQ